HPRGVMAINAGTYIRSTFNTFEWAPNFPNVGGGLQDFDDATGGVQWVNDALGNPIYVPGGTFNPAAYHNPSFSGRFIERPASLEFLDSVSNASSLQVNAGIRVHGSTFHRPRYASHPDGSGDWTAPFDIPFSAISDASLASYLKFSLRMYFRGDYGPTKLTWPIFPGDPLTPSYDKVVLRGGHNDGFNPFMKDELTRRLYIDMGHVNARGEIYNLYINGVYRGYYNATERHDEDFLATRFASTKDWDILTHPVNVAFDMDNPQLKEGDKVSWDALMAAVAAHTASQSQGNYDAIAAILDIDAFIDYLLVQLYTGNDDWPSNNWGAAHERVPGGKWIFLVWDAEATFNSGNINKTGLNYFPFWWGGGSGLKGMGGSLPRIYRACVLNTGFRTTFRTRAVTHLGPGGALDMVNVSARFNELKTTMISVMPGGEIFNDYIGTTWIPAREAVLIMDLQMEGLYP
ncbi:MAG: CotH kinase family protein, partial [Candidatus Hydrogenedentes bacterium]|nr:CotH kinase family protein [Candidatus Hydrogenedentota bacterium]